MKRLRRSYPISLVLALMLLGSMLFGNWSASALTTASPATKLSNPGGDQVTSGTILVTPSNLAGWRWMEEDTAAGGGMLVTGPATPPLGTGSARLSVDSTGRFILSNLAYAGTRLADITSLAYSSYSEGASTILAPSLNFDIDYDLTDANTAWQGRLVYEPYQDGSVITPGTWQTWSPMTGKWWASGAPGNSTCPQSLPCTWSQVLTAFPNAGLRAGNGWLHFRVGQWAGGFTGYVDGFTMGVSGNNTTYDFERPAGTLVVGTCPGATYSTIQAAVTAAVAGDTIQVCPGSYNENVNINKNNITLVGAGASSNASYGTIIEGATPTNIGNNPGITLPPNVTGVSIRNLRVQNFNANSGIYATANNNNFTADSITAYNNNSTGSANGAGIFMHGPVSYVTINNVTADSNKARGIVIWDGFKQHITFTNNIVTNNGCCGMELQDGTASGVTMTGNYIANNGDSGMAAVGLMYGAGPNVIANNVLLNNGRFGIEIKLPNGSGLETGDGSIVISGNSVARTVAIGAEARDIAGISVYRRGYVVGYNNVDIPTGVVVKNNTVSGYQQPSSADGFGIVVESLQTNVYGNTVTGNDVGIQRQAGHLPYTPNTAVDGDQSTANEPDNYFGRGNSPAVCAQIGTNTYSGNTINTRDVGPVNALPCGNNAFAHLQPTSPITVAAGSTVTLDLLINGGTHSIRGQQSYMTFPTTLLQNILVGSGGTVTNTVSPDLTSLDTVLQNQVCNTPTPCMFGSLTAPGGSIAYASGALTGPAPSGDFRVAQIAFAANQVGTATVHWQFSPPDPANRNSQINDDSNNVVSGPTLYQDYVINIVHAVFTGHVTWEGRPAQPNVLQALPITLTLTNTTTLAAYTFPATTDANGNFSVNVDNLPDGTYTWRVKGTQTLSTSGSVVLSHALNTNVEMGLQPTGDANNDNLVDVTDFGILYATFGSNADPRADFDGSGVVDITDFGLLRGNFGRLGNLPGKVVEKQADGSAVLELRPQGKAPVNGGTVHVGDSFTLELWVNAQAGTSVVGQQSYLTFPAGQLQLGNQKNLGPRTGSNGLLTPDGSVLDTTLQNAICNGSASCVFNGQKVPAGSLAFASGTLSPVAGSGAFRVATVTVQATAAGTARLHWQFGTNGRDTKIVTDGGVTVSQPDQFVDYVLNVLPAGK